MQLLLCHLQVQQVTKLCMDLRDMDTQSQTTLTRPVTEIATDKALPSTSPTYRTHIHYKHNKSRHLLLSIWQRQKVTSGGAHTPVCRLTIRVCRFLKDQHSLSVHMTLLPVSRTTLPTPWVACSPAGPA